jgi:hypothetical protein
MTLSSFCFADYGTRAVAVAHDSEHPALQIPGAVRAPASVKDSLDLSVIDRAI